MIVIRPPFLRPRLRPHGLAGRFVAAFGPRWNPLYQLGALGFFYYWIVAVSGIYLYIVLRHRGTTERL